MLYLTVLFALCIFALAIDSGMTRAGVINSNREQRILNMVLVGLLILCAGLRNVGGTDFLVYGRIYMNTPTLGELIENFDVVYDKYFVYGVDKGYLIINSIFRTLGFSYYGYNFMHSLLVISAIYFFTRRFGNNFAMVVMFMMYKMFFYDFFISLRQTITIAIFMGMLADIEKKHWTRYYIMCCVCYYIHAAAIVLFAVYFIRYLKLSRGTLLLLNAIFLPTLVLSVLNVPVLSVFDYMLNWDIFSSDQIADKATGLITSNAEAGIDWLHTAEYFVVMFLLVWFYDDIEEEFPNSEMMIKLFVCLLPIFTLFRNYEILTRWKDYFTISYGFIFVYLSGIREKKYQSLIMLMLVLWCGFGYFRFMTLFDEGSFKSYIPVYRYGVPFFDFNNR